jgi:hypothetical protein
VDRLSRNSLFSEFALFQLGQQYLTSYILEVRNIPAEGKGFGWLGLDEKLKELGFNEPRAAAAIGTITGRCYEPESELATHTWLQERSGLGHLLDYDFNNLSLYGMYMISDKLFKNKAAIEQHVYE